MIPEQITYYRLSLEQLIIKFREHSKVNITLHDIFTIENIKNFGGAIFYNLKKKTVLDSEDSAISVYGLLVFLVRAEVLPEGNYIIKGG